MATATAPSSTQLTADPQLYRAIQAAVGSALTMCNVAARCVGLSSIPPRDTGIVTGLIGVHGKVSGFVTVNIGQRFAIKLVEGLLQDKYNEITSQVVDGVGEITNIITGSIKSELSGTPFAFPNMTVPSVIVGSGYQIAYAKGLEFLCVTFEHLDAEAVMLTDRLMNVSVSLLKL